MFMKQKANLPAPPHPALLNSNNNNNTAPAPVTPPLTRHTAKSHTSPTISFSSQHTPQSFIASAHPHSNADPATNHDHNSHSNPAESSNNYNSHKSKSRKSRWDNASDKDHSHSNNTKHSSNKSPSTTQDITKSSKKAKENATNRGSQSRSRSPCSSSVRRRRYSRSRTRSRSRSRHKQQGRANKDGRKRSDSEDIDMSISDDSSDSFSSSPRSSRTSSNTTPTPRPPQKPQSETAKDAVEGEGGKDGDGNTNENGEETKCNTIGAAKDNEKDEKADDSKLDETPKLSEKYVQSEDMTMIHSTFRNHSKRNYAKEELEKKQKCSVELKNYIKRTKHKRKRGKQRRKCRKTMQIYQKMVEYHHNISANEFADDEDADDMDFDIDREHSQQPRTEQQVKKKLKRYNQDIGDSDFAVYEPPFKKPRYMKKMKQFVSENQEYLPHCKVREVGEFNQKLQVSRLKFRKQREQYINDDRKHSGHWNATPTPCKFYRCVHMLEGHVSTMCTSPDMAAGVSSPRKLLDEIEKHLSRIHPLPPLIYKRLFKTLANLANLIRNYPDAVLWDAHKLQSIFEKAIRKQQQMATIYDFDGVEFVHYDFSPFQLPIGERQNVSFYVGHNEDKRQEEGKLISMEAIPMNSMSRQHSAMSATVDDVMDDDEEEENDECDAGEDEEEEEEEGDEEEDDNVHGNNTNNNSNVSRSVTPSDHLKDLTPALSLTSNPTSSTLDTLDPHQQRNDNINRLPTKAKNKEFLSEFYSINHTPSQSQSQSQSQSKASSQSQAAPPSLAPSLSTPTPTSTIPPSQSLLVTALFSPSALKRKRSSKPADGLVMEIPLNLDSLRKTVAVNASSSGDADNHSKHNVSSKMQQLLKENWQIMEEWKNHEKRRQQSPSQQINPKQKQSQSKKNEDNSTQHTNKKANVVATKGNYTWRLEKVDSGDENVTDSVKEDKKLLMEIFRNGGVYGSIKANGLEPTNQELPTLYQYPFTFRSLSEKRVPSISYLIRNYIDIKDTWHIQMLLKYFTVQLAANGTNDDHQNEADEGDKTTASTKEEKAPHITSKTIINKVRENPKCIKHTYIGTVRCEDDNNDDNDAEHNAEDALCCPQSTIVFEIYIDIDDQAHFTRLGLDESKRHRLLCKLLRIKNQHKKELLQRKHAWLNKVCIPQPPPPPLGMKSNAKKLSRLNQMYTICINYNWNGSCEIKYCNKKHICVSCLGKHPARICKKVCFLFNFAKCAKYCPHHKKHVCSQCGDSKHSAWKCTYLSKSVTERYYAIYKAIKIQNGFFEGEVNKERQKNKDWINKKRAKIASRDPSLFQVYAMTANRRHHPHNSNAHKITANNNNENNNNNTNVRPTAAAAKMIQHHIHNFNNNLNSLHVNKQPQNLSNLSNMNTNNNNNNALRRNVPSHANQGHPIANPRHTPHVHPYPHAHPYQHAYPNAHPHLQQHHNPNVHHPAHQHPHLRNSNQHHLQAPHAHVVHSSYHNGSYQKAKRIIRK